MTHGTRGFTLTEMLVVMSILAILFALATPAALSMREGSRLASCASNVGSLNKRDKTFETETGDLVCDISMKEFSNYGDGMSNEKHTITSSTKRAGGRFSVVQGGGIMTVVWEVMYRGGINNLSSQVFQWTTGTRSTFW